MFVARNYEFFRDKAAFGWNFAFPFLIIIGFSIMFGHQDQKQFKIGVFPVDSPSSAFSQGTVPASLQTSKQLDFVTFPNQKEGEEKLRHYKIDLLLDRNSTTHAYWINEASPNGYLAEQIFLASFLSKDQPVAAKQVVHGEQIRYVDWFFPGVMAMNMMFSALWGVGFVVVRYRKNGTLKRLKATPLTAFEYLTAQMISRIFLLMFTLCVVWFGSNLIFHFQIHGSYLLVFFLFFLGGLNLCGMGLVLAQKFGLIAIALLFLKKGAIIVVALFAGAARWFSGLFGSKKKKAAATSTPAQPANFLIDEPRPAPPPADPPTV